MGNELCIKLSPSNRDPSGATIAADFMVVATAICVLPKDGDVFLQGWDVVLQSIVEDFGNALPEKSWWAKSSTTSTMNADVQRRHTGQSVHVRLTTEEVQICLLAERIGGEWPERNVNW